MNARGRPRKNEEEQLIERVSTRLRDKDRKRLQRIAESSGIAPEILVRVAVLDFMRKKEQDGAILSAL